VNTKNAKSIAPKGKTAEVKQVHKPSSKTKTKKPATPKATIESKPVTKSSDKTNAESKKDAIKANH
jgi:hypothetical protein